MLFGGLPDQPLRGPDRRRDERHGHDRGGRRGEHQRDRIADGHDREHRHDSGPGQRAEREQPPAEPCPYRRPVEQSFLAQRVAHPRQLRPDRTCVGQRADRQPRLVVPRSATAQPVCPRLGQHHAVQRLRRRVGVRFPSGEGAVPDGEVVEGDAARDGHQLLAQEQPTDAGRHGVRPPPAAAQQGQLGGVERALRDVRVRHGGPRPPRDPPRPHHRDAVPTEDQPRDHGYGEAGTVRSVPRSRAPGAPAPSGAGGPG